VKQAFATVIANAAVARDVFVLRLEEPSQAREVSPGQFVHLRCAAGATTYDPLLRRPLSVLRTGTCPINPLPREQYDVLYAVVGRGTDWLSQRRPGEHLDVLGPLGRPFTLERATRRLLLVGGGVGIVPLVALAEEAIHRRLTVTLVAGFRTADQAYPAAELPPEVEYVVTTDDRSAGRPGRVTEHLAEYLSWADQLCACGPVPMLQALARLPLPRGLPVQVAMEAQMGCAMGVCLGCVVPTRHGYQRVCRDGPVFPLEEMGWR
jgi:dihydroorotate dehydrogenase electron transfer subunit